MKIKSNSDGSKWIEITDTLLLFKPYSNDNILLILAKLFT